MLMKPLRRSRRSSAARNLRAGKLRLIFVAAVVPAVLEAAVQAAVGRAQSHPEPEHILPVTVVDRDGPSARVLPGCGVNLEQIADEFRHQASL
jgi:hypothetical protein